MIGTKTIVNFSQIRLDKVNNILDYIGSIDKYQIDLMEISEKTINDLKIAKEVLESCVLLEQKHKVVVLDAEARRECRDKDGKLHTIQLVFRSNLPAKSITILDKNNYRFCARTPQPTKEAIEAIRQHKNKFDGLQVWWVPNEILVQRIPDPDPILIGYRNVPKLGLICFELCRWVDETVEEGWWAREGY